MWSFGVAATGVKGLLVHDDRREWDETHRVSADLERYERFTQASNLELAQDPSEVAS